MTDNLLEELDSARQTVKTDTYAMSVGELATMYSDSELNLNPAFQRLFRWSNFQKSSLIESIVLGMPIPSIFMAQDAAGLWDVIDGVQRLSTIFEVMGILKDREGALKPPLVLSKTKYLPSLEGKVWQEEPAQDYSSLPQLVRMTIKRAKLHVVIVQRESSKDTKFELFQRLNTGGSPASRQEVRNCMLVMLNDNRYTAFRDLTEDERFLKCLLLTDSAAEKQLAGEFALRFLSLISADSAKIGALGDLGDFLDAEIENIAELTSSEWLKRSEIFNQVFKELVLQLDGEALRKYDVKSNAFTGGMYAAAFEFVAIGIGRELYRNRPMPNRLADRIKEAWIEGHLTSTSAGKRANTRIKETLEEASEFWLK